MASKSDLCTSVRYRDAHCYLPLVEGVLLIKLVLTDMDNTLVPIGAGRVSSRALCAIEGLRSVGITFGLITGRSPSELLPFFGGDAGYFSTGVLCNGKKVFVDGECVLSRGFEFDALERLLAIVRTVPRTFMCFYPEENGGRNLVYAVGGAPDLVDGFAQRVGFLPTSMEVPPDVPYLGAVIASEASHEAMEALRVRASSEVPELDIYETFAGWYDVLPHGVNKATGLRVLMRELGVAPGDVVVFGDGENDLAMMGEVENSVAVANAMPSVAKTARWHVGASAEDGVAIAMEQIAQAAREGGTPKFMGLS